MVPPPINPRDRDEVAALRARGYKAGKILGKGSYAKVKECIREGSNPKPGEKVAVKVGLRFRLLIPYRFPSPFSLRLFLFRSSTRQRKGARDT